MQKCLRFYDTLFVFAKGLRIMSDLSVRWIKFEYKEIGRKRRKDHTHTRTYEHTDT